MSRALFVSDIHIASAEDPKYKQFLALLEACLTARVDSLFLVGDIFDFWIADRRFLVATYAGAVDLIRKLREAGVAVHYFEGNHDLDLHPFWERELGVSVHTEAEYFNLDGVWFRVEHGDQMDPLDRGYLFLRWLLRTPAMVFLGRVLPEFFVRWLGMRASGVSREYTTQVKVASDEVVRAKVRRHAVQVWARRPFSVLVSGHVHVADDYSFEISGVGSIRSVNLGTWLKKPVVLDVRDGDVGLRPLAEFLTGH